MLLVLHDVMESDACLRHFCTGEKKKVTLQTGAGAHNTWWQRRERGCPWERSTGLWPGLSILLTDIPDADPALVSCSFSLAQSWQDTAESNLLSFLREAATMCKTQKWLKSSLSDCCRSMYFHLLSMFPVLNLYDVIIILQIQDNLGNEVCSVEDTSIWGEGEFPAPSPMLSSYISPRIKAELRRAQFKLADDQIRLLIIFI